jgi:large subunit ribosomal protein L30
MNGKNYIKIKLIKSSIARNKKIKSTLIGLGLTKLSKEVEVLNSPSNRGMVKKVINLIEIVRS